MPRYFLAPGFRVWLDTMMIKACWALAFFCLVFLLPLRAFEWETVTSGDREYVTLHSFCVFYGFGYEVPSGNDRFFSRNGPHSISLKVGTSDIYLDDVHYVLSFPIEQGDRDWLVSRMDVIKLFEPILRPREIEGRHTIRGVVIDPGHGGTDNGATSRFGAEKNYALDTAFRLQDILRRAGMRAVLTRNTDVFVDLYERANIASLYPDYAFISIHYNSAMPEARGLETYCLSPRGAASTSSSYLTRGDIQKLPGNDYDTQNILLASMVHSEIIKLNPGDPTADRGVKRARFVVIKQNVLPAILVEGGFVSNHMEAARVNEGSYRQSLAEAIACGVIRFANVMGDRNMPLPGGSEEEDTESPPPFAEKPAAPSGLASDPANAAIQSTSTVSTTHKSKKSKTKKVVATPELSQPPVSILVGGTPSAASVDGASGTQPSSSTPSGALNLTEPPPPAPSAGADKAPAEPDEPPTVTIYPTAPTPPANSGSKTSTPTNSPATNAAPTGDTP